MKRAQNMKFHKRMNPRKQERETTTDSLILGISEDENPFFLVGTISLSLSLSPHTENHMHMHVNSGVWPIDTDFCLYNQ